MKYLNFLLSISILWVFGCSQEDQISVIDPSNQISGQVEQLNSDDDFKTAIKSFETKFKSAGWQLNSDGKIALTREILFDVVLENNQSVELGFWFVKYETDDNDLILQDEHLNYWERSWDYSTTEAERKNFFQEFDEARVMINANVIFHHESNENFRVESVEPAQVDGEEKSYITIKFNGDAYGWYDPSGAYQEVYKLTDGVFKGIIE